MKLNKYGFVGISHVETNGVGIYCREVTMRSTALAEYLVVNIKITT
jgi:hypothetical protein